MIVNQITFPAFGGIRCLMMPYIQGVPESVPSEYRAGYESILASVYVRAGDIGFLTIDESRAKRGIPHRGARAKWGRALHTEVGRHPDREYVWGGGGWGSSDRVTVSREVEVLIANNVDNSCAIWDVEREDTSEDGDIGNEADNYPYSKAVFMRSGEVHRIGILTPHESLPVEQDVNRQFLRIVSSGVYGREPYFTENALVSIK